MPAEVLEPPKTVAQGHGKIQQIGFTLLLLVSGFCGLSYEVLYGRLLSNFIGDQFAISAAILLTFMLGLGCGALWAHRFWRWLWLVEAVIGAYATAAALGSQYLEKWFYSVPFFTGGIGGAVTACFVLLMAPSFAIGCSLPLFAGYLSKLNPEGVFARAYTVYNFGAALTVLLLEFVLLRHLGIRATILVMAALNAGAALMLMSFYRGLGRPVNPPASAALIGRKLLLSLVLASVASAVFQLLMVKMAECFLGPFRHTFALVLAVVLFGLAFGSAAVRRFRLPFVWLLVAALAGTAWILASLDWLAGTYAALQPSANMRPLTAVLLKVGLLMACMGVPACAFGALIPALLREQLDVARNSGRLLFFSSIANAGGFLLMAFVLHRLLDYGVVLLVVGVITGAAVLVSAGLRSRPAFAALLILGASVVLHQTRWDEHLLYLGYDRFRSSEELQANRSHLRFPERFKGHQDVFALNHLGNDVHFFINGYISIALNSPAEKIVGALPSLFAPATDRALVLGVGSGATCGTVARLFDQVDGVEINPVVLQNLFRMAEYNFDLAARTNAHFVLDDAIRFTKVCQERYPLIINTVTAPIYFSSSKLYTVDFLSSVRRCLRPGGLYVTWIDSRIGDRGLDIILKTVKASGFQECSLAGIKSGYFLLLCSDEPIRLRQPQLLVNNPLLSRYFETNGVLPRLLPYSLLSTKAFDLVMDPAAPLNSLDYPALEYLMAALDVKYEAKWASRLVEKMSIEELKPALEPAMKIDPLDLALHTERLYRDSPISAARIRLLDDASDEFYDQFQAAKLVYYQKWADQANAAHVRKLFADELARQKKFEHAIAEIVKALALEPNDYEAFHTIATYYEKAGDYDKALENLVEQQKRFPQHDRLPVAFGRIYYKMENFAAALPHLRRGIRNSDSAESYLYLSLTLKALGKDEEAEAAYQEGLKAGTQRAKPTETSNSSARR